MESFFRSSTVASQSHQTGGRLIHSFTVTLYIQPGAKTAHLAGVHDGKVKIALKAPARDNQANQALIDFLADILGASKSQIHLLRGQKSRIKTIEIQGDEELLERCAALLTDNQSSPSA